MFINFSNHPSSKWGDKQKEAAFAYGQIQDISFPVVPATATKDEIKGLAREYAEKISAYNPTCVMCQGEFSMAVAVIKMLQKMNITCVCACSDRVTTEVIQMDGTMIKTSAFEFIQFREYI